MSDIIIQQCATQILDTIQLITRAIGTEMNKHTSADISFQQLRTMIAINKKEGTSLSEVAEHLGATVSAASKMVDGLVERGLITRETDSDDRRKLVLALTEDGKVLMEKIYQERLEHITQRLSSLSQSECSMVNLTMDLLRSVFA